MIDPTQVRAAKQELTARLFGSAYAATSTPAGAAVPWGGNVLGVGFGAKVTGGTISADEAVRVYVRSKLGRRDLSSELVPDEVGGLPTDVLAVGDVVTFARPVRCGVSIGHRDVTAGTLGCLVRRGTEETPHILSNNHVLADVNRGAPGDPILEPGPADGGTEPIAELTEFEPIVMGGEPNRFDAAIARVLNPADVLPELKEIGSVVNPPVPPLLYRSVRKHGRSTLHTVGVVLDVSADVWVRVLPQESAWFEDQLGVVGVQGPFSRPGDSGSLVVDALNHAPAGLLFAGGGDHTFVSPIQPVLERFDATIIEADPTA